MHGSPQLILALLLAAVPASAGAVFDIDTAHSSVGFRVSHMVISRTSGKFTEFSGSFEFEGEDPGKAKSGSAEALIKTASIDTANEKRDAHLRGPDFFNVKEFPEIRFEGRKVKMLGKKKGKLHGELTMRGITRPTVLDLEFHGVVNDPRGDERAGFTATTTIDRTDYGITWNKAMDQGGLVVGEEVEITLEIEGIRRKK